MTLRADFDKLKKLAREYLEVSGPEWTQGDYCPLCDGDRSHKPDCEYLVARKALETMVKGGEKNVREYSR